MGALQLTEEQTSAKGSFINFLLADDQPEFVLEGYAGTGKSTLVRHLLDEVPKITNMINRVISVNNTKKEMSVVLTATTNKACEALGQLTRQEVKTIQSVLGLRVSKDYKTGETRLVKKGNAEPVQDKILIIDEASFIDHALLQRIRECTVNCKVMYIGDPAQLTAINVSVAPVFTSGIPTATLEEVVRQAKSSQITELATLFRNTVNTGEFFQFVPDGKDVQHLSRSAFDAEITTEFSRKDWQYTDSKVLAWTNKCAIEYNKAIRNLAQGSPELVPGDYAVCNNFVSSRNGKHSVKTDEIVCIRALTADSRHGVAGHFVDIGAAYDYFMPASRDAALAANKKAKRENNYSALKEIDAQWLDLRAAYACTINKSQGSTYSKVFIDLDDVKKCRNLNTVARLLYVAVSRASSQVILTGDLG